jgi:hypothetical protein
MTAAGERPIIVPVMLFSPFGNGVVGDLVFACGLGLEFASFDFANYLKLELAGEAAPFY